MLREVQCARPTLVTSWGCRHAYLLHGPFAYTNCAQTCRACMPHPVAPANPQCAVPALQNTVLRPAANGSDGSASSDSSNAPHPPLPPMTLHPMGSMGSMGYPPFMAVYHPLTSMGSWNPAGGPPEPGSPRNGGPPSPLMGSPVGTPTGNSHAHLHGVGSTHAGMSKGGRRHAAGAGLRGRGRARGCMPAQGILVQWSCMLCSSTPCNACHSRLTHTCHCHTCPHNCPSQP